MKFVRVSALLKINWYSHATSGSGQTEISGWPHSGEFRDKPISFHIFYFQANIVHKCPLYERVSMD